ncbi:MAG: DUF4153 domain-containing protein [Bacteroidales bacterium]|nr:DUF4153 domain-containing protein [Bacteroidales bacterium]
MSRLNEIPGRLWQGFAKSVREFPLEALLGVTYFVIFLFGNSISGAVDRSDVYSLFFWFFPQYVLLFTLNKLSGKHKPLRILYFLAWFLWIPLLFRAPENPGWSLAAAYIIALVLLVIGEEPLDNESYAKNILDNALLVAKGFLTGFLLMGTLTALIASTNYLFGLNLTDNWFSFPNAFIAFVIIPLLCCYLVTRSQAKYSWRIILQVAVDYILSPALELYTAILYIYIANILVRWKLPDGGVAYLVASFMIVALACHLFRHLVEKRHSEWFYKAFPLIAVPPLALLWTGVIRRIGDYGITEPRFYLLLLTLLLTLFTAMLIKERTRKFQLMTLILAASLAAFTFIPGIRAKDFERRSQAGRPREIAEIEGQATSELGKRWSLDQIPEPIDLGEYTLLVPKSGYHYFEDDSAAIFYRDSTRTEELLRCGIRRALDSPDEDPLGKLVYKNDDYMAVFDLIEDFRSSLLSFAPGNVTLYKKTVPGNH